MIEFGAPTHGWLEICFSSRDSKSCFEVSDVGPDTIGQFVKALASIKSTEDEIEIECFLEHSILMVVLTPSATMVHIALKLDGAKVERFKFERSRLIENLETELEKLIPLCVHPNWTHTNWCRE